MTRLKLGNWKQDLEEHGKTWTIDDIIEIRAQLGLLNPTIIDCTTR